MLKFCTPLAMLLICSCAWSQNPAFKGELGLMGVHNSAIVTGEKARFDVLPYVYGDWGRAYARIDTFGVRTLPLGSGHLELAMRAGREGLEGRSAAYPGLNERRSPTPLGLGTFQVTPAGGVFVYLMHDPVSSGHFAELSWAARLALGSATLYPQLTAQYRSASYVNHLYGLTPAQVADTGLASYRAGRSVLSQAAVHLTLPLSGPWSLQTQVRYRWLDDAVARSPLVNSRSQTSGLMALTYTLN